MHIYHKFITPIESDGYVEAQEGTVKNIFPGVKRDSIVAYNVNSGFICNTILSRLIDFYDADGQRRSEKHANLMLKNMHQANKMDFVEGDPQKTLIADIINEQYELVDTRIRVLLM